MMEPLRLLALIAMLLLSFIPVLRLHHYRHYATFTALRYTVNIVFAWAFIKTLQHAVSDVMPVMGYYLHLAGYVVVLMVAMSFHNTIMSFIRRPVPKTIKAIGMVYLAVFTLALLSNDLLHLLVIEGSEDVGNLRDVLDLSVTGLFNFHVFIIYLLLGVSVGVLLIHLKSMRLKALYKVPYYFFITALIAGVILNYIHIYLNPFLLDPTFVVIVVFAFLLYYVIYHKDMGFILISESRKTLIDNMQEMYIVADEKNQVVDCSDELKRRFGIDRSEKAENIIEALEKKAVLYEDIDEVEDKSIDLPYLNIIQKTFTLGKTDYKGRLYLFYDETHFVKIMRKLEYLQSHDEMTGLYNRNYFEQTFPALQRTFPNAVILITDINGLKLFNDFFGHKRGDDLILNFASILKSITEGREDTRLIRLGGDEFMVFIGDGDKRDAEQFKRRILDATYHEDPLKRISTSVGYAVRRPDENLETTFLRADHALYNMKKEASKAYRKAFLEAYGHSDKVDPGQG